jgi:hypothetical protein
MIAFHVQWEDGGESEEHDWEEVEEGTAVDDEEVIELLSDDSDGGGRSASGAYVRSCLSLALH